MAEIHNILTGAMGEKRPRASAIAAGAQPQHGEDMAALKASLEALRADIVRLGNEVAAAHADLRTARADVQAQRDRSDALQARLDARNGAIADLERNLAGAHAAAEGLQGQLATERAAREAMKAPLEQAIAAAAKPPVIVHPQQAEPVAYEVVVVGRDMNSRMEKLVLKPMKAS